MKSPVLLGVNVTSAGFSGLYFDIDAQIANVKPVRDIQALQDQYNWLSSLHGDLAGLEGEFLSRDFYALRRRRSSEPMGQES